MEKRRAITLGMKLEALFRLGLVKCGRCHGVIAAPRLCEWNHIREIALGGEHSAKNLEPTHGRHSEEKCHQAYTAAFLKAEGKVRRLNGSTPKRKGRPIPQRVDPWPKGQKIRSAGFPKNIRRKLSGAIERVGG